MPQPGVLGPGDVGSHDPPANLLVGMHRLPPVAFLHQPEGRKHHRSEIAVLDDIETHLGRAGRQLASAIPSEVPEVLVVRVVERRAGGNDDRRDAARTENPEELSQCFEVVTNVFQHVGRHDDVNHARTYGQPG